MNDVNPYGHLMAACVNAAAQIVTYPDSIPAQPEDAIAPLAVKIYKAVIRESSK